MRLEAGFGEHEALERDKAVWISLAALHRCFSARNFTDIRLDCRLTMYVLGSTYTTSHQACVDRKMVRLAGRPTRGSSGP